MKKANIYRILEIENKAGSKQWACQYKRFWLFGLFYYWQNFYYDESFQFLKEYDFLMKYTNFCNAKNCIKYHKMFSQDKDKLKIIEIND